MTIALEYWRLDTSWMVNWSGLICHPSSYQVYVTVNVLYAFQLNGKLYMLPFNKPSDRDWVEKREEGRNLERRREERD